MISRRHNFRRRRGFTLVEVLATLVLMGTILPVVMNGVSLALHSASIAKHQAEAAALAETRLQEIMLFGDWNQMATSGQFEQHPEYRWTCQTMPHDDPYSNTTEITLTVTWMERNQERSVSVSTLAYSSDTSASSSSSTGGGE